MIKKAPHTLKTDELLDLLEEAEKSPEPQEQDLSQYKNDILTFLSVFDIKQGTDYIKKNTLYSIYKVWSKRPLWKKDFLTEIDALFQSHGTSGYKINHNAIKLTHDAYVKFKTEGVKLTSKHWTIHFQGFLEYHALETGDFWIEDDLLFFLYDKYTYITGADSRHKGCLKKKDFYKFCDLFLNKKITKYGRVYGLSTNIQNFFQAGQLARMKEAYGKEKEAKNAERIARIPRTRSKVQSEDEG